MKEQLIKLFAENGLDLKDTETAEMLHEAFQRVFNRDQRWKMVKAKDHHVCVRGCKVDKGDVFFKNTLSEEKTVKICARCVAMVLYFMEAHSKGSAFQDW